MRHTARIQKIGRGSWWLVGVLLTLGWGLPGGATDPGTVAESVPASATPAINSTATATPTVDAAATAIWSTATAVSRTATAISLTATAQAAQGTVVSIGATQTALAATITALADASPSTTHTPTASATATPTPVPCLDAYEPDGEPAAAKPLLPGEKQRHLICPAGDADWLTFFGKPGKSYQIATSELSAGVDTYLYLFASDGRTVLAQNDDAPDGHGESELVWTAPADGWYFVQVKNQGDIGDPGLGYTLSLTVAALPTVTPVSPTSTSVPVSPTATPGGPPSSPTLAAPTTTPMAATTPTPDPILHPQGGGAGTGGVPVFDAGPSDGMVADRLESNDRFEQAYPINVGALYQHLNFVPTVAGQSDEDFYSFRAKPGNCYAVTTGDLSAGLDTTVLLWAAAPIREGRRLLAQNDDAHPHTADLSSTVRWCNPIGGPDDLWLVAQIRNYGLTPGTDPHGKTYSLLVEIDPPTPTPTPSPRPSPADPPLPPVSGGGGSGGSGGGPVPMPPGLLPPTARPSLSPGTVTPPTPMLSQPTITVIPTPALISTVTIAATPGAPVTPSATPAWVQVDVVAYVAPPGDLDPLHGPQPDDGIQDMTVLLIDAPTNAVQGTALTDANGHAALHWGWTGPVRIALPALRWGRTLTWDDVQRESKGTERLYLEARTTGYPLPGIFP